MQKAFVTSGAIIVGIISLVLITWKVSIIFI